MTTLYTTCTNFTCETHLTDLIYRLQKNNTKHLVGFCSEHGWIYLPFKSDLDIPTVDSKLRSKRNKRTGVRYIKENKPSNQANLFTG